MNVSSMTFEVGSVRQVKLVSSDQEVFIQKKDLVSKFSGMLKNLFEGVLWFFLSYMPPSAFVVLIYRTNCVVLGKIFPMRNRCLCRM